MCMIVPCNKEAESTLSRQRAKCKKLLKFCTEKVVAWGPPSLAVLRRVALGRESLEIFSCSLKVGGCVCVEIVLDPATPESPCVQIAMDYCSQAVPSLTKC